MDRAGVAKKTKEQLEKLRGKHFNRIVYKEYAIELINGINPETRDCAEISGNLGKKFSFKSYDAYHFPDYDVCRAPFQNEDGDLLTFDMIIADQVWEHLDRPYKATQNVYSMLNDGGYFYICVPFFVRYHLYPVDCSRWSARGLKNLLIEGGFDEAKIHSDQWGNLDCARKESGKRFARFNPDTDNLRNDPDFPVVAWALAQK